MKQYFLFDVERPSLLPFALGRALPGQTEPWLLLDPTGDPVAYFNIVRENQVHADISGRHYYSDTEVVAVLETIRLDVGGRIEDDF